MDSDCARPSNDEEDLGPKAKSGGVNEGPNQERIQFLKVLRNARRVASGKRVANACSSCKRSRVRCDETRPCRRCILYADITSCETNITSSAVSPVLFSLAAHEHNAKKILSSEQDHKDRLDTSRHQNFKTHNLKGKKPNDDGPRSCDLLDASSSLQCLQGEVIPKPTTEMPPSASPNLPIIPAKLSTEVLSAQRTPELLGPYQAALTLPQSSGAPSRTDLALQLQQFRALLQQHEQQRLAADAALRCAASHLLQQLLHAAASVPTALPTSEATAAAAEQAFLATLASLGGQVKPEPSMGGSTSAAWPSTSAAWPGDRSGEPPS
eukprot:CAMPEP_0113702110 /NCGR_PEP_ID=MMETSP0038_2-20120614/24985_1 /TAXON_ID=2898 /ORGANISM="Cryptomonas paramecium" /LENGTH=323 /DNA_ID=CAMNT_0000626151 /DNA_START=104 /DNA_END=1071 /DNA_ORIENTATION=+ /assembly_acc=CAM_ASM_000170